ncbi:MAG: sulfatase-like hydrolase/transferase, partial [Candidatus Zixiibacteriota bacterium]
NCLVYADHAVGGFVDAFSDRPVFDSTLFVFVSDHCLWGRHRWFTDPLNFHIPLLIYSPALLGSEGRAIDKPGSQTDLVPTLMGILGSDYVHASFGRDLRRLEADDPGFAVVNLKDRAAMSEDGVTWCIEHLGHTQYMARIDTLSGAMWYVHDSLPEDFERLLRRIRIWLQAGEQLSTPQDATQAPTSSAAIKP